MAKPGAALIEELQGAVDTALAGNWQGAHEVAQRHEDEPLACWLHAVCHRMEGDLPNARYWYRQCGRAYRAEVTTEDELREIRSTLAGPPAD